MPSPACKKYGFNGSFSSSLGYGDGLVTLHNIGFYFLNDTPTTVVYSLSLHDALPIYRPPGEIGRRAQRGLALFGERCAHVVAQRVRQCGGAADLQDRKSTRLNSSHSQNSYAVSCLQKIWIQWILFQQFGLW